MSSEDVNCNNEANTDDKDLSKSLSSINLGSPLTNSKQQQQPTSENSANGLNKPRQEYLDWHEYFMAVSFLSAKRSKDPATQVGACIVNPDKRIVGIGYNGMPRGCSDSDLPWGKTSINELENKYMYVCHAEMNAILNKNSASVDGCSIYVALFPCNECSKMIIQSGIKEVIYFSDKHAAKNSTIASKRLLDMAGVTYKQYIPRMKTLTIDFHDADPLLYNTK